MERQGRRPCLKEKRQDNLMDLGDEMLLWVVEVGSEDA